MRDRFGPEISDVIVDYDATTLERKAIAKDAAIARLAGMATAQRIARTIGERDGAIDPVIVDGILVRSHLELQRLHEEFRVGFTVRELLVPMLDAIRRTRDARPIRVVDLGCGMGYMVRWLAARGALGDDVELVGADYNRTFVRAAQKLADAERLRCRFVAGNAFALEVPADIVISTGVLHHFRGDDLAAVFAQHEQSTALAFVHVDIRPSAIAPLGSWIFHRARMREPLARFDGYWSTVRAHDAKTMRAVVGAATPGFATAMVDARPGLAALLRIFQATIGVRRELAIDLRTAYAGFKRRLEVGP